MVEPCPICNKPIPGDFVVVQTRDGKYVKVCRRCYDNRPKGIEIPKPYKEQ